MKTVTIILAIFATALSLIAENAERPNILLIVTDDQSPFAEPYPGKREPDSWGAYGANVYSPHVDELASEGMIFGDANAASPVCGPSRYSFLTGRYASRCEGPRFLELFPKGEMARPGNVIELEEDRSNVARVLKTGGYRTAFVGKSHLIRHDAIHGPKRWDRKGLRSYGLDDDPFDPRVSAAMEHNNGVWTGWMQKFGWDYVNGFYTANLKEQYNREAEVHNLEWTTRAALQFLDTVEEEDDPFFLYFSTTLPHGPNPWVKDKQTGKYKYSMDADPRITAEGIKEYDYSFMPERSELVETVVEKGFPEDTAYLSWMDAGVGALMQKLEDVGVAENTLVILISDHGAWRTGKATLHEGGMRVPMIVRWPGKVKEGSRFDGLVSLVDLVPTFYEVAGVEDSESLDGKSLTPVFDSNGETRIHETIFSEIGYARGVKTERWKYIAVRYPKHVQEQIARGERFPEYQGPKRDLPYLTRNSHLGYHAAQTNPHYFDKDQLYDLHADPMEEKNIAASNPEVVEAMKAKLSEYLRTFEERPFGEFSE
ncbi:sulfatase family protein [Pelagicoccus mobilis]|uniref:Sulfatase-like hydrolase/transferase n=1 Tax=Pelagicoccus mobilis TaxID=415221 RepID=A0A934RU62_9BACT|nr:sulfatase-like hydrolase/transferase [Pelagicoccus mobilis]MBK1876493.1 sulfatase-like hydrolase/transferase [Pelagicoccus mobilis]